MTDKITYFSVNNFRSITFSSATWDTTGRAHEVAIEFFNRLPDDIIDDLGIVFKEDPFYETTLHIPIEKANAISKKRGLPYRFIIDFWTFKEDLVDAFLHTNNILCWDVMSELLRTKYGMEDDASIKFSFNIWEHFINEIQKKLLNYVLQYSVEIDEFGGHRIIVKNLSAAQKGAKDLIISIAEGFLANIKKVGE
ncbi:MAG: hypothetical protein CVU71_07085 [Deltaproteobacteria bacterium HGW-Deltaproteobacteria-6]|nr:MAG: hypothetical protein CVU71_07085 [Deltaproteobacteria bacterium HGW-Deltaproteobacteria-6]